MKAQPVPLQKTHHGYVVVCKHPNKILSMGWDWGTEFHEDPETALNRAEELADLMSNEKLTFKVLKATLTIEETKRRKRIK